MNAPKLLSLLLSLALLGPASAQPTFDGLSSGTGDGTLGQGTSPIRGTGDGFETLAPDAFPLEGGAHPTSPHWDGVAADLEASDGLLDRVMEAYAAIVDASGFQSDAGRNKFFFRDLTDYNTAVRHADALSQDLKEAYTKLQRAGETLTTMERSDEPLWALEGRTEWTRQATIYNQMHDWSRRRILKYDTLRWGDEQKRQLLTSQWDVRPLSLPRSSGVREDTHLSPSMAAPLTDRYLAQLDEALQAATAAQEILERERIAPESADEERRTLAGWILYRYTTTAIFDSLIKEKATEYALAMLEAKAAMNAAVLATEAPSSGQFAEQAHMDLRMAMIRYSPLAWWGDYRFLQVVSSWGFLKREMWIFDGAGFRNQHRIDTGGIESEHLEDVLEHFRGQGGRSTVAGD